MYHNRINELEKLHTSLDNQLFQLEKAGSRDPSLIESLRKKKSDCLNELRHLRRLEFDDRQRVNFDDDR